MEAFKSHPLRAMANKTVVMDGVVDAALMVIGEAPGSDEDRIGKPFVGRSGRLLDEIFASVGVSRQHNVIITNTVYWRPPMNRTPEHDELQMCAPFMRRLVALVRPKTIVLLGATAVRSFFGLSADATVSLKSLRGGWYPAQPVEGDRLERLALSDIHHADLSTPLAMIGYHPSFLLRQPTSKMYAWHDMVMLKGRLRHQSFPFAEFSSLPSVSSSAPSDS